VWHEGFLRTPHTARYWSRRWQLQVYRDGGWVIARHGARWSASVGGDPVNGWQADVLDGCWRSATVSVVPHPTGRRRWRDGFVVVVQRDPISL
jgi:hypothetical protein